jgi:hypothetical protein
MKNSQAFEKHEKQRKKNVLSSEKIILYVIIEKIKKRDNKES